MTPHDIEIVEAETASPAWEQHRATGVWAIVEIMGHKVRAGSISDAQLGGATLLRIQHPSLPDHDGAGPLTELYSSSALFSVRPCARDTATRWAETHWCAPKESAMVQLTAAADVIDDDFEEPYYDGGF